MMLMRRKWCRDDLSGNVYPSYAPGILAERTTKLGNLVQLKKNESGVFHVVVTNGEVVKKKFSYTHASAARRRFKDVAA